MPNDKQHCQSPDQEPLIQAMPDFNCDANPQMNTAWQFVTSTGVSVFLTGNAGTGKTTFLRHLKEQSPKRMVVLAPTGVAAINAGGQTIHSFFQFPFGPFIPGASKNNRNHFKMADRKKELIRSLDLLVIDEVSMVRADMLDQIDDALRRLKDRYRPFGGVQLLLIGDLMQLPPVLKEEEHRLLSDHYTTPYFFSSHALQQLPMVTIELTHIYRQQDQRFIQLLGNIRDGKIDNATLTALNSRHIPDFEADAPGWIRLTTHNIAAHEYNNERLKRLKGEEMTFQATVKGDFPELSYPTDQSLTLKEGAQVMFVKNDPSPRHQYYNGKIGIIDHFTDDAIEIVCGHERILVSPVQWENTKYTLDEKTKEIEENVVGVFKQYPLRLAWAITVHKSQGLTFDHAVLDVAAAFAHGQVYVALSRCRSLEGLVLSRPLEWHSVITDKTVNSYMSQALQGAGEWSSRLDDLKTEYMISLLDDLYSFRRILYDTRHLSRVVDEHLSAKLPELLTELKAVGDLVEQSLALTAARFAMQYRQALGTTCGELSGSPLEGRIMSSASYFADELHKMFAPIWPKTSVAIRNKTIAATYRRALQALKRSVADKIALFKPLRSTPFTTSVYLNLKAKIELKSSQSK